MTISERGQVVEAELELRRADRSIMNTNRLQRKILLNNPNGLHLRPSAAFVQLVEQFQSSVVVSSAEGKTANGRSIWDLLGLAALPGTELTLEVDGPDAQQAIEALSALLSETHPVEN